MSTKIYGYCKGKSIPITDVKDPVFSEKMLGDGIAIVPDTNFRNVVAPFDATICLVANTSHAIGLLGEGDKEFLIHIGLDTVELKGSAFKPMVTVNQTVKRGDVLVVVDWSDIEAHNLDTTVIFVNCDNTIDNFKYNTFKEVDENTVILEF